MGRDARKIFLNLAGAAIPTLAVLILAQALLSGPPRGLEAAAPLQIQVGVQVGLMVSIALLGGLAILCYIRLSLSMRSRKGGEDDREARGAGGSKGGL